MLPPAVYGGLLGVATVWRVYVVTPAPTRPCTNQCSLIVRPIENAPWAVYPSSRRENVRLVDTSIPICVRGLSEYPQPTLTLPLVVCGIVNVAPASVVCPKLRCWVRIAETEMRNKLRPVGAYDKLACADADPKRCPYRYVSSGSKCPPAPVNADAIWASVNVPLSMAPARLSNVAGRDAASPNAFAAK